jgi:pyruvate dehydrogenase E2 component (dihydrolipoamide acetyltransferase)
MTTRREIQVPDLGDFSDVEIVEVMVSAGERVNAEDPLITLETDKAAMDVPAPEAGSVVELKVSVGDRVSEGDVILVLDSSASATSERAPTPAATPAAPTATPAAPAGAAATETRRVLVPDLGDFDAADIAEVHVAPGSLLAPEDPVITLETDKAAMDVPSPAAGEVLMVAVEAGQQISAGALILEMKTAAGQPEEPAVEDTQPSKPPPAVAAPQEAPIQSRPQPAAAGLPPIDEQTFAKAHASPSVRKFARELGVDLGRVKGSGEKGRVLQDDVKAFVKSALEGRAEAPAGATLPAVPVVDFAKFGEIEVKPLGRIQKISGPRLHASWLNLPHVTQHDEADITEMEQRRQRLKQAAADQDVRLTPLAFIIKACVITLKEFPAVNSSLSEDLQSLVYKKYFHIGFAADTPQGLLVPVIRDADLKDVMTIAKELGELSERARAGKLKPDEMQGGAFTVSSLGGIGGTFFTPIINAPEVAILGVGRSAQRPVYRDGDFVPRLILPLSLSYDHRVIDGATGVRFITYLRGVLEDVDRLLLGS